MKISVILPTYNERENINDLIAEINLYLKSHVRRPFEVIVVDDDSPDKTWQAAGEYYAGQEHIRVIRRRAGRGLAAAIREGIQAADGDIVAWMDCDFSMPPYKLAELINCVCAGCDICVGSRNVKNGKDVRGPTDSWLAVVLSRAMNNFIAAVLGQSFKDYTSGFVAARKDIFKEIKLIDGYGEYFIDFIFRARKKGYRIMEMPYYCLPRRRGVSKTGSNLPDYLRRGLRYISLTLRLRFGRMDKNG